MNHPKFFYLTKSNQCRLKFLDSNSEYPFVQNRFSMQIMHGKYDLIEEIKHFEAFKICHATGRRKTQKALIYYTRKVFLQGV